MKKQIIITALLAIACSSCLESASRINGVSLGMSKTEVIRVMGQPASVTATTNAVTLNYNLAEVPTAFDLPGTPYEVQLVNDKVVSYGRSGSPSPERPIPIVVPPPVIAR